MEFGIFIGQSAIGEIAGNDNGADIGRMRRGCFERGKCLLIAVNFAIGELAGRTQMEITQMQYFNDREP